MLKRFRHLRISLAAKCQILFGAAVVLIIGAALYVPFKRMEGLMEDQNLLSAQTLAVDAINQHVNRENALAANPSIAPSVAQFLAQTRPSDNAAYIPPRLILINGPRTAALDRYEQAAIKSFRAHPDESHMPRTYRLKQQERYWLAMPLYNMQSCMGCHDSEPPARLAPAAVQAAAGGAATMASTKPAVSRLVGIVTVDIASQVNPNDLFLNRTIILLAGVLAGTLAVIVFYLITNQLILQPVRVLQETAEKVSQGDLNIRSDISTGDEFQQLSETFNTMLSNLKTSADQLESINKALDLKLGQLSETNVALYESNRLKSEFLANVSHELRTPLNSILGFAELLRESVAAGLGDGKPARYLQNILSSGQNLLDLINDLLDLAKIEAGRMEVRSQPLSLGDVFEGLINLLKPLSEVRNVTIVPEVATGVPIIETDPAKLQQVLYNLLSNAIKFSPAGGKVDLLAVTEGAGQVRISVTDQGPGIQPEMQEVIFEKFRQIDGSVTREHSGTGLGLAISRELVSLLGGTIGISSEPGHGATFWVLVPLKTQPGMRDLRTPMTSAP